LVDPSPQRGKCPRNPDSFTSIHYVTQSNPSGWTTSEWVGSGNNAVYNGVDFGMDPNNDDNGAALKLALDAAIAGGGGKVFIPSGIFRFKSTVIRAALGDEDVGIIIEGTAGSELVADFEAAGGKLLSFENFGTRGNGIRIRNLRISYATSRHHQAAGPAIYVKDCENVSVNQGTLPIVRAHSLTTARPYSVGWLIAPSTTRLARTTK
ncbi:MAG: hypothetical protein WBW87_10255, partial [Candidatus Cybelea sp.]